MKIRLEPAGLEIETKAGAPLDTLLAPHGVEFPCGGAANCRGCRVRVLEGSIAVTPEMEAMFTEAELAEGWRLACQGVASAGLVLEVGQWEMSILGDDRALPVEAREGCGIAVDIGTTTVVAQLVDLRTGEILGVESTLNPQAEYGADLMTRIEAAATDAPRLRKLIRDCVRELSAKLGRSSAVVETVLCGNTAMHHLYCGIDVQPLASAPFETSALGAVRMGGELFMPCLGSFVGSDILAGILATGMDGSSQFHALVDLGTNGEIVVGTGERMICASTAAGPAFEAGRIKMGMRASTGAIAHVMNGRVKVLGDVEPRGICGSGLVDAVAMALADGRMRATGRLTTEDKRCVVAGDVYLTQSDIRELQLAKGAIAAGVRILAARFDAGVAAIETLYLAGAFGNYLSLESARAIGLIEPEIRNVVPSGNTALAGARLVLLNPSKRDYYLGEVPGRVSHLPLAADAEFQDVFAECMGF